jgi:hypothetical protein
VGQEDFECLVENKKNAKNMNELGKVSLEAICLKDRK